ncbi:MAG: hypothetical protein ACP6IP_05770 [Candidatus Njordarchaeia archaeon]
MKWRHQVIAISLILLILIEFAPLLANSTNVSGSKVYEEGFGAGKAALNNIVFPGSDYNVTFKAVRTVSISPYGVVELNDSVAVTNNDFREFNSILIFYGKDELSILDNIRIVGKSSEGEKIVITWLPYVEYENYIGFAIVFDRFVKRDSSYSVIIRADIKVVPDFDVVDNELYLSISFSQKMLLPYNISKMDVFFVTTDSNAHIDEDRITPKNGTKVAETKYKYEFDHIIPFNMTGEVSPNIVNFVWKTTTPLMYVSQLTREFTFGISDIVHVRDVFDIRVIAPPSSAPASQSNWKINSLTIGIPADVEDLTVRDAMGRITARKTSSFLVPSNLDAYSINLRVPLTFGDSYRISLSYSIKSDSDFFKVDKDKVNLTVPLLPVINTTVMNFRLVLNVPNGYLLEHLNYMNRSLELYKGVNVDLAGLFVYDKFSASMDNIVPSMNHNMEIIIDKTPVPLFSLFIKLFIIILTIITLIDLIYARYQVYEREEVSPLLIEERKKLKKSLSTFLKYYEEFITLETNLDEFIRKRITVRKSPRVIKEELNRLMGEVKKQRDKIIMTSEKLTDDREVYKIVKELLKIEDRVNFTRRELISDWSQFLGGKLGKKELTIRARNVFNDLKVYKINRTRLVNRLKNIYASKYSKL